MTDRRTALARLAALGLAGFARAQTPPAPTPTPAPDQALTLIQEAKASFARVRDYMGTLVKEERVNGMLQPEQYIELRVRQQPFSVYLKWQGPKQFVGQEAMFVSGKNDNRLRAKGTGLAAIAGYVSLDPRDPRAMAQSRHVITDTGIGYLIETVWKNYELERRFPANVVQVKYADYAFQGKTHTCMETTHLTNNGQFYAYRTLVFFDKETKLPMRFEAYDWPTPGGNPKGEKLEVYSYVNVKFNVGLTDAAFEK
ncbi:MAG: DUF1571 domain-containing protein [Gemmataceae bacterium]